VPSIIIGLVAGTLTIVGLRFGSRIGERFGLFAETSAVWSWWPTACRSSPPTWPVTPRKVGRLPEGYRGAKADHILGASGSGTTTLGAELARQLHCPHFDSDAYLWHPTDPPFDRIRPREERQRLLMADLGSSDAWILSGSLCGWGDVAIPLFDLVIYLWIPQDIRLARLMQRERERYGPAAIALGAAARQGEAVSGLGGRLRRGRPGYAQPSQPPAMARCAGLQVLRSKLT